MKPPRVTFPSAKFGWLVQVTDDGSRTLIHPDTGIAFHSAAGALSETKHVYLQNSGVAQRLRDRMPTRVLEVGFGTAMGMLVTADFAAAQQAALEFVSLEKDLLSTAVIRELEPWNWVSHSSLSDHVLTWLDQIQAAPAGNRLKRNLGDDLSLELVLGPAQAWSAHAERPFHAVYFDPFAPSDNEDLWQPSMLREMYECLAPGGKLVTYCVSRMARDLIREAGFDVRTTAGPQGGKRDVLIATKSIPASAATSTSTG